MVAAGDGHEGVARDLEVVHPEISPYLDVIRVAFVNGNDPVGRDADVALGILAADYIGDVLVDGSEAGLSFLSRLGFGGGVGAYFIPYGCLLIISK